MSADPLAVLDALGIADASAVEPVSGGWDTAIWRVERGGERYALRLFRLEQAAACRHEVAAMRAAAEGGVPVPRLYAEGVWQGRPVLLLSWCPGRTLLEEVQARPWRGWTLGVAMGRMHARVHAIPAPEALRRNPDAWIDWAGPVDAALRARLLAVAPDTPALLHLDYHPLNILTDGADITAVLDWANTRAGDRRADLARTLAILRLAPPEPGASPLLMLGRRVLERAWRRGYRQVAGRVAGMAPFYAWAGGTMARDLASKLGRPGVWLERRHLDAIEGWAAVWRRRAGLPADDHLGKAPRP
ncbi:MAG: phosphotransferase [Chloroflexota bacterium]|nr:phosphotransferase [Chloroflexota bacterium]